MKKLGIFIAAGALTLSLAACGSALPAQQLPQRLQKPQQQLPQKLQQQVLQLN